MKTLSKQFTRSLRRTLCATSLMLSLAGTTCALHAETVAATPFSFTVTSDLHDDTALCTHVFNAIKAQPEGVGAFMISVGDLADHEGQTPQNLRDLIDSQLGETTLWFTLPGNHDTRSPYSFQWLRNEFSKGHNKRPPLKSHQLKAGPAGSSETTYSFDQGDLHIVMLNEYWIGRDEPGNDYAGKGDVVPALRAWLEADLKATDKPYVLVFGHEPAFPLHRHVGDSLDAYPENRDAFWSLLAKYKVQAFVSGHIHYYYKLEKDGVFQISDGAAGKDVEGHQTFLRIVVSGTELQIEAWQNDNAARDTWRKADTTLLKPRTLP